MVRHFAGGLVDHTQPGVVQGDGEVELLVERGREGIVEATDRVPLRARDQEAGAGHAIHVADEIVFAPCRVLAAPVRFAQAVVTQDTAGLLYRAVEL